LGKPLISVIVPVYNVEKYLDRCIESIVKQTYKNLEIILVDDGSPDSCPVICDEWANRDSRVSVIHKANDGLAHARNSGLEISSGEFILFIDSDDYLEPDMIGFLLNNILDYNADVSRCGFYYDYENDSSVRIGESNKRILLLNSDEIISELASGSHVSGVVWNKLYRACSIKNVQFSKKDGCSEDILFNYRVYKNASKTVFYDLPKYHYNVRQDSITESDFGSGAFDIIRAKRIILQNESNNGVTYPYAVKGMIKSAFIVLSGCIQNNKFEKEQEELINLILSHKKEILMSSLYSMNDKMKTAALILSKNIFIKTILRKHSNG